MNFDFHSKEFICVPHLNPKIEVKIFNTSISGPLARQNFAEIQYVNNQYNIERWRLLNTHFKADTFSNQHWLKINEILLGKAFVCVTNKIVMDNLLSCVQ